MQTKEEYAVLLCWDKDGESWSWTRKNARYKMQEERQSMGWQSIHLSFMLLCATGPG